MAVPLPTTASGAQRSSSINHAPREASETELRVAIALGQLAAATLAFESYVAQTRCGRSRAPRDTHAYLADASALLGSLKSPAGRCGKARQLTVPRMAYGAPSISSIRAGLSNAWAQPTSNRRRSQMRWTSRRVPVGPKCHDRRAERAAHRPA